MVAVSVIVCVIVNGTVRMIMSVLMVAMPMALRMRSKTQLGMFVDLIGRTWQWRHALQLHDQFPLRPQRPQADDDHEQTGGQRHPCLDALRHHPWQADRREYAHQHDAACMRQRYEYSQDHCVDGPAARADDISSGNGLAVTRRRGVNGADPERGDEVDQGIGHGR